MGMKVRTLLACAGMLLALAFGIAACGDDDGAGGGEDGAASPSSTRSSATLAPDEVPDGWVAGKVPPRLAEIGRRLEDAGYTISSLEDRERDQALRVGMREGGSAYVLPKQRDTTKRLLARTERDSKGNLRVELIGSNIYLANSGPMPLSGEEKLTDAQRDEFEKIVSIATGEG
jgi:hypothetical protein